MLSYSPLTGAEGVNTVKSISDFLHKFVRDQSGQGNQEFGSALAFSVIILFVVFGMFYGIQNGFIKGLTDRTNYMASHANQSMY